MCRELIAPRACQADRSGTLSHESWGDLIKAGYFGLFHPPELGGTGADGVILGLAMETLARSCGGTFWAATISTALCGKMLLALGTEEHHRRWLPALARGEKIGSFSVVERSAGSETNRCETVLRKVGDRYVLRGEKARVSNGPVADMTCSYARLEAPDARPGEMAYAVVDLHTPGVKRTPLELIGLRAMPFGMLTFDDVEIEEPDVLRISDVDRMMQAVEWGQLLQAFSSVGFAEEACQLACAFARDRTAFGRPIAHLQIVQSRIADLRVQIEGARLLAYEAALHKAAGRLARDVVMMAKIHATEMAAQATEHALRLFGSVAYIAGHPAERLHRDSLLNVPAGLTTDRLRELLVCPAVGADPWRYGPSDWLGATSMRST
jgi:alkylation response protein AidB-like acyl-CoA dehydrogenase